MLEDLNLLTKDELNNLEKYVKKTIKKSSKNVDKLFEDLKSGKLKNKRIEVDALDFVHEGLSEIVEKWEKERKLAEKQEVGEIEKLVCAPNTKIGKFLSKDKRKQLTLAEGIGVLKKQNKLNDLLNHIADLENRRDLFKFSSHDLEHTKRVLINCDVLINLIGNISERERKILLTAIKFHDTGREHDFEDKTHGINAVKQLGKEIEDFSEEEQELIKFIIIEHCKSTGENETAISVLNKSNKEKSIYRKLLNIMKDADKLDRVRFPEISPIVKEALDPDRLKNEEAKSLIKFACELFESGDKFLTTKYSHKNLDYLFERTKIFAEGEEGEDLSRSVERVLAENKYPKRSGRLDMKNLDNIEEKFLKDGYLYLFRGSRKGQKSGFYTYPYGKEKQNVEKYLKENPGFTADQLAKNQSLRGKERFISATSSLYIALGFTRYDKLNNPEGSVYIIKIKPEEVYKIFTPMQEMFKTIDPEDNYKGIKDEREYLIPDYIKPEEIIKEFDCRDLKEIYEFLTKDIGLNITLKDIGIDEKLMESEEYLTEVLDEINEKKANHLWDNMTDSQRADVEIGFQILSQMMNNPKYSEMINGLIKGIITQSLMDDDLRKK